MNLKNLKVLTVVLTILALTFSSCEKEELTEQPVDNITNSTEIKVTDLPILEVQDGMLTFEDNEQFFNTIELLNNASPEVVKDWEKSIGFKSLNTLQEEALDDLNLIDNKKGLNLWLETNKDYFEKVSYEGEIFIEATNKLDFYSNICNSNSMYIISNTCFKICKDLIAETEKENSNKIKELNYYEILNNNNYKIKQPLKSSHFDELIQSRTNYSNNRKCKMQTNVYAEAGPYYSLHWVNLKVKGYRKLFGVYFQYKTDLQWKNVSGTIYRSYGGNEYTHSISFNDKSDTKVYKIEKTNYYNGFGTVYFKKFKGKASSKGIGNLWAEIDYLDSNL